MKKIALLKQVGSMSANMLFVSVGITGRQARCILAKLKKREESCDMEQIKTVTGKL